MKISPVVTNKIGEAVRWTFGIGTFAFGCFLFNKSHNMVIKEEKAAQEIVKEHNPILYKKMLEEDAGLYPWQNAAEAIQDSLKIDSIAKTNYALGMQAVRDSLASTNKSK